MNIIDWINKIKYQMLAKIQLWYQNWGGPDLYISANTCGRVPSRAISHKSTYTLNLFSVFHYLALMYKSETPQCCYYISIFANIWYLIKLIHSIIIILRVFMFINSASWQTFEVEKTARFFQSQAQRCMLLRCAYEMSDKQFVYADHAVFSTSKVC